MNKDRKQLMDDVFGINGNGGLKPPPEIRAMLVSMLGGGKPIIAGDEVKFHDGKQIVLPKGMTYQRAYEILARLEQEAETETQFDRSYKYRPNDGAYALLQVLSERYGMVLGEKIDMGFFGTMPPETRTIAIGVNKNIQVPWGLISIPTLQGVKIHLCDRHPNADYGKVFELHVTAPRKYKDEIKAMFDAVEEQLKTSSIYRGQAVVGSDDLEFLDLSGFDASKIVFADSVTATLEGTLWATFKHSQTLRDEGISLKRALLLYGPYGTGKTSLGQMIAQVATENGWTFISARPGRDRVEDVLRTARLYQPAVVFVEDIDTQTSTGDEDDVSAFLDAFDGITAKGGELVAVMTTNHIQKIHKGMLRPGRLDAVIEIAGLDRGGVERLVKAIVPTGKLAADIDYDIVFKAMDGFLPAFVRESLERARTFAISRLNGQRDYVLATTDIVNAAESLRPQLQALNDAGEGKRMPTLDTALRAAVANAIDGSAMTYNAESKSAHDEWVLTVPAVKLNGATPVVTTE